MLDVSDDRATDEISPPTYVRLEASSFCQLRCPSCPTATGSLRPTVGSGFLRPQDFKTLIDRNPDLKRVELSNWGEVFLNPRLLSILEYATERGVVISIGNGANLNNVREEVLDAIVRLGVANITCSIDGASQETYEKYRVKGNFDVVIANIKKINEYKSKYQTELPHLVWQFVVFGHNEHEIPVARAMAEQLGMTFQTKLTWDEDFSPIRDEAFVRRETGSDVTSRTEYEARHGTLYRRQRCDALWDGVQINWDGKILGCVHNSWGDFGRHAFDGELKTSLNGEKIAYARGMLTGRRPPRDDIPCTTCENYLHMCSKKQFLRDKLKD